MYTTATTVVARTSTQKRVVRLQMVTLAWMLVECSLALYSAWRAKSVSLLAFGSDSLVEVISAGVVLLQFAPSCKISQSRAARACGLLLFVLAGVVVFIAVGGIWLHVDADMSIPGIVVTVGALLMMPTLARLKRRAAEDLGDRALRADAVQSATCAYVAAITLAGLLLRWMFGVHWVDQLAALAAVPILIVEGRRALKGQTCSCC